MQSCGIDRETATRVEARRECEALREDLAELIESDIELLPCELRDQEILKRTRRLSPREWQVMRLLYAGSTMKQIAGKLGIRHQTVAKHRQSLLDKMGVEGEADLARILTIFALQGTQEHGQGTAARVPGA